MPGEASANPNASTKIQTGINEYILLHGNQEEGVVEAARKKELMNGRKTKKEGKAEATKETEAERKTQGKTEKLIYIYIYQKER